MSGPVDGNGKRDDPSAYAPKWARDSNREGSRENTTPQQSEQSVPEKAPAGDQARQESRMPRSLDPQFLRDPPRAPREQSVPEKAPASDQAHAHRPLDTTFTREARLPPRGWRSRAETELPEGGEEARLQMP